MRKSLRTFFIRSRCSTNERGRFIPCLKDKYVAEIDKTPRITWLVHFVPLSTPSTGTYKLCRRASMQVHRVLKFTQVRNVAPGIARTLAHTKVLHLPPPPAPHHRPVTSAPMRIQAE